MSPENLKSNIVEMNEEHLNDAMLQQLIRYMPPQDQLKRLEESRKDFNSLAEAEQFALTVSSFSKTCIESVIFISLNFTAWINQKFKQTIKCHIFQIEI